MECTVKNNNFKEYNRRQRLLKDRQELKELKRVEKSLINLQKDLNANENLYATTKLRIDRNKEKQELLQGEILLNEIDNVAQNPRYKYFIDLVPVQLIPILMGSLAFSSNFSLQALAQPVAEMRNWGITPDGYLKINPANFLFLTHTLIPIFRSLGALVITMIFMIKILNMLIKHENNFFIKTGEILVKCLGAYICLEILPIMPEILIGNFY